METKKIFTNEEILETIKNMSVREVVEFIEGLDPAMELKNQESQPEEIEYDPFELVEFDAIPNFKVKGSHVKPFYQTSRW